MTPIKKIFKMEKISSSCHTGSQQKINHSCISVNVKNVALQNIIKMKYSDVCFGQSEEGNLMPISQQLFNDSNAFHQF